MGPFYLKSAGIVSAALFLGSVFLSGATVSAAERPNVLIAISDDQSYPHASAYGHPVVRTPGFDEVARRGVLFHQAFTPAPGCSPMRAAFLTGRYIWQIREAGTHASRFPADLMTFPHALQQAGYRIGTTGKPWGPGNYRASGRQENPAGPAYSQLRQEAPKGISKTDYAANLDAFLDQTEDESPFCFWFGGHEPHRSFDRGIGAKSGMSASEVVVPGFLPDSDEVRSDLLDYFFEIQWFDQHLVRMLRSLERRGMLENTLVIVTSDNGMSFPRAKANLYEYGIHMPLAISWPEKFDGRQSTDALVNLIDVTATIYEACAVQPPQQITGKSLLDVLCGREKSVQSAVFSGRERHSSSRWNSLGYPSRCVRTDEFLYIRNYAPERWPAGAPRKYSKVTYDVEGRDVSAKLGPEHGGYHDIDACPSLSYMIENRTEASVARLFDLAVAKRPREEFYSVKEDVACLENLAAQGHPELDLHRELLTAELLRSGDLREVNFQASHIWETYPRYSSLRWFPRPDWDRDASPQQRVPTQDWLEQRRPK